MRTDHQHKSGLGISTGTGSAGVGGLLARSARARVIHKTRAMVRVIMSGSFTWYRMDLDLELMIGSIQRHQNMAHRRTCKALGTDGHNWPTAELSSYRVVDDLVRVPNECTVIWAVKTLIAAEVSCCNPSFVGRLWLDRLQPYEAISALTPAAGRPCPQNAYIVRRFKSQTIGDGRPVQRAGW